MRWIALHERADTILCEVDAQKLTAAQITFLTSIRDKKIVWGTDKQVAYIEAIKQQVLPVQTQAVSGANNRSS